MEKKLMGVFAPISTPFTADRRVDYEGLAPPIEIPDVYHGRRVS